MNENGLARLSELVLTNADVFTNSDFNSRFVGIPDKLLSPYSKPPSNSLAILASIIARFASVRT
jgi:hypothetical protein